MTTIRINGVTLSANATLNGFPLRLTAETPHGRYPHNRRDAESRLRRSERVFVRSMKQAMVEALS